MCWGSSQLLENIFQVVLIFTCTRDYDTTCVFIDTMSPNAVFEYAGDRETLDDDNDKPIAFQEDELTKK